MKNSKNIILIIFLFVLLGTCLFYTKQKDKFVSRDFLNTNYDKTIYLVWRNDQKLGFGDKLRGCITLYQYCKTNKLNFRIDATDDVCSNFLKNIKSPDYEKIKDKEIILHSTNNGVLLPDVIQRELANKDTIYLFTNAYPFNDLDDDDREFAKFICEPNDTLEVEVNEKIKKLPENFTIKHFRFRDYVYKKDIKSNDEIFQKSFNILKLKYKPTDVLFTNSNNFKEYAKQNLNIKTIDCDNEICKLAHTGQSLDNESIKNTFIEFFIMSRSTYTQSYTCYHWPSGFAYWITKIYDIPFENIFVEDEKNKDKW